MTSDKPPLITHKRTITLEVSVRTTSIARFDRVLASSMPYLRQQAEAALSQALDDRDPNSVWSQLVVLIRSTGPAVDDGRSV